MRRLTLLFAFVALAGGLVVPALATEAYQPFRADLPAGAAWALDARKIHPTQFALGWREVIAKRDALDAMTAAARETYLKEKDVPLVIGPGGVPYLTDGHHTLRALLESRAEDKTAFGHVLANWSDQEPAVFWQRMAASRYVYLRDARGRGAQPPADLPGSLGAMQRDPYRGLAWGVMKAGGFKERKDVFFQEFLWADYFRSRMAWDDTDDAAFARAVKEAVALASAPEAVDLPGYLRPALVPRVITEPTLHDTDDPAIWINPADRARSLIIGTDKDTDGALYVFDLDGRIVKRVGGLKRPNNVDVGYGFALGGERLDIAVTTEREMQRLRVFRLPEMTALDGGDLVVFDGDQNRAPMGIALYRRPRDGAMFAIVGGKSGPTEGYLAQYRLEDDGQGKVRMKLVRHFGRYSGRKEIEAIAVDAELGHVYYSDEGFGVRKYAVDPDAPRAGDELAVFGTTGFAADHEGISIYKTSERTGYILVSDQQADQFQIFKREGEPGQPHTHARVKTVSVQTLESDGSEVTSLALGPNFPHGLFVAMSNGRVFHYYAWEDIAGDDLARASPR